MAVSYHVRLDRPLEPYGLAEDHLRDEFRRLDLRMLLQFFSRGHQHQAPGGLPGMVVTTDEVVRLLAGVDATDDLTEMPIVAEWEEELDELDEFIPARLELNRRESQLLPLQQLVKRFQLSNREQQILLMALAVETDRRYEKILGWFQDDLTCKLFTVDTLIRLSAAEPEPPLAGLQLFLSEAALVRAGLIKLLPSPETHTLLAHQVKLEEDVWRFLLGAPIAEPQNETCRANLSVPAETMTGLVDELNRSPMAMLMVCEGPERDQKWRFVEEFSAASGLTIHVTCALAGEPPPSEKFRDLGRIARLHGEVVVLDGLPATSVVPQLEKMIQHVRSSCEALIIMVDRCPRQLHRLQPFVIKFPNPIPSERKQIWSELAANEKAVLAEEDLDFVARHYHLNREQIELCWATALNRQTQSGRSRETISREVIVGACLDVTEVDPGILARRVRPRRSWSQLVLADSAKKSLRQIIERVHHQHDVFHEWGYDAITGGKSGISLLFAGPPGTGKTLAAEVLAHELGWNLYQVDLSQVVSKYIGETEKQLQTVFQRCGDGNSVLLFDEADALFGKRTETRDAHDRYANLTTAFLLQQLEQHPGMTILSTNAPDNLDNAFSRRFTRCVEFAPPNADQRHQLWELFLPPEVPLAETVDIRILAQSINLTGGHCRNIALSAAFFARAENTAIQEKHLELAARQEYEKIGRTWNGLRDAAP